MRLLRKISAACGTAAIVAALVSVAPATAGASTHGHHKHSANKHHHGHATNKHKINLGAGKVTVGKGKLNIAFFSDGSTNTYLESANSAAENAAKKAHVSLTYFDGNFTPTAETNQMEQALASGKYNAWSVESSSPDACHLIKEAIKKKILVSVFNGPQCHPNTTEGAKAWIKGTLNFVAGDQTYKTFHKWLAKIAKLNPGPQHALVITGPTGLSQTPFTDEAIKAVEKKDPTFTATSEPTPKYTTAGSDAIASAYLTGHPTTTIVAGNYSTLTLGGLEAVKAAGDLGKIKVYDSGGSKQVAQDIKKGLIQLTQPYLPATESRDSVVSIIKAWHGKVGPHYITIMKSLKGGERFITKKNVTSYKPQF